MSEFIFICGHPKSGTTLLATLLDGHSDVVVFPEETFLLRQMARRPRQNALQWLDWLLSEGHPARLAQSSIAPGVDGNANYDAIDFEEMYAVTRQIVAKNPTPDSVLPALLLAYAQITGQSDKRYWLVKTPGNEFVLQQITRWYPSARLLYIMRDPRDVYASYERKAALRHNAALNAESFVVRWGLSVAAWSRYHSSPYKKLIRYETLVQQPEPALSELVSFLGIDFEAALEHPTKAGGDWHGNSMHGDSFDNISSKPVGRWIHQLTPEQVVTIENYLGRVMRRYGYELSQTPDRALWREWLSESRDRKRLLGMIIGLYWPWQIPVHWQRRLHLEL